MLVVVGIIWVLAWCHDAHLLMPCALSGVVSSNSGCSLTLQDEIRQQKLSILRFLKRRNTVVPSFTVRGKVQVTSVFHIEMPFFTPWEPIVP